MLKKTSCISSFLSWIITIAGPMLAAQLSAQTSPFYDLPPAPPYIEERMGPFGPQQKSYPVPAGAVFCSPDGLDNNSGASIDEPTTLARAITHAATGATIVLRGGTYRTGDIAFRKQITIQPYLDEKPIIKGTKIAGNWRQSGNHWKTSWTTLFFKSQEGLSPIMKFDAKIQYLWNKDRVFIDGVISKPVATVADLKPGKFFVDYANNEIHIGDNPTGKIIEITAYEKGLTREHFDQTTDKAYPDADPQGPTIQGLVMMQYADVMLSVQGRDTHALIEPGAMPIGPQGTRILNNRFIFSGSVCLSLTGTPEATIAYNDISFGGHVGMSIRLAHKSVVEHNIISFNNPNDLRNFPAGVKVFNQCLSLIVRNNYCYGNKAIAVWYDVGHREGVVVDNYFADNAHCIKTEISHRVYIAGNVMNKSPLWLVNVANNMVYNNTLIDSKLTIMRNDRGIRPDSRASFNHNATGPGPAGYNGHEIANNVFAHSDAKKDDPYLAIEDRNGVDTKFPASIIAHNLFSGKTTLFAKVNSIFLKLGTDKVPIKYNTLKDFLGSFPDYVKDCAQMDKSPEDLFRNPSLGDYRLRSADGAPTGGSVPDFIAVQLGWKPAVCGVGALAQFPGGKP